MYVTMFYDFYYGVIDMEHKAVKYKDILEEFYYLDSQGNLRYKSKGYYDRYNEDSLVKTRLSDTGYCLVHIPKIRNKSNGSISVYLAHVVWVLSGKQFPKDKELDHIDGNRLNNHISNLRLVNRTVNSKNRKKRSDNTSGITGICWNKAHNSWCIRRTVKGKRLATYRKTLEEAKQVLEKFTALDPDYTKRHGK